MGMQAQGQQLQRPGQLYYDYDTGQQYYMGYEGMNPNDPYNGLKLLGQMLRTGQKQTPQKIYVNGANNQSMTARQIPQFTPVDINALFPQLMQGSEMTAPVANGLLGSGAAQSASSGAGRFM